MNVTFECSIQLKKLFLSTTKLNEVNVYDVTKCMS